MQSLSGNLAALNHFLTRGGRRSLSEDEETYNGPSFANHSPSKGNPVCLPGSFKGSLKYNSFNRKKGEAVPRTLCKPNVERGREKLCTVREAGTFITSHVTKVKKVSWQNFLSETPTGESVESFFRTPEVVLEKDDTHGLSSLMVLPATSVLEQVWS
ncbi:hypothetical protein Tco_0183352 [Tanacetum coccineum]